MHQNLIFNTSLTETFYYKQKIDFLKCTLDCVDTIGGRIKYYRLTNHITQEELAARAGLNPCTIKRIESNSIDNPLETCKKIARAIGVSPELFYDDYLAFIASDYSYKIKQVRKELHLTQQKFGGLLNLHRKTILRWEKRIDCPSRENFILLRKKRLI